MPRLHEQVALLLDTDGFKERMRAEGLGEANLDRWHELKVLVVSRLLTAQYALVLTVLAIRVRLNIVSRHYLLEMQAAATSLPQAVALGVRPTLADPLLVMNPRGKHRSPQNEARTSSLELCTRTTRK